MNNTSKTQWKRVNNQTITLREYVSIENLRAIIDNFDEVFEMIPRAVSDPQYEKPSIQNYTKLLNRAVRSKDKGYNVKYTQVKSNATKDGRYFADQGLQGMCREIRQTISKDFYHDLDIKNCHPTILKHLCTKYGLFTENLDFYLRNREELFSNFEKKGIKKDVIKTLFLKVMNGGQLSDEEIVLVGNEFFPEFQEEMKGICKRLIPEFEEAYGTDIDEKHGVNYFNRNGAILNRAFCDMENQILFHIFNYLTSVGFEIGTLVFDGLMIRKGKELSSEVLRACENSVRNALKIDIKLDVKEMCDCIDLSRFKLNLQKIQRSIDWDDRGICFADFSSHIRRTTFQSLRELNEYVINTMPRVLAYIQAGEGYYIKKDGNDSFSMIKRFTIELYCDYIKNGEVVRVDFKKILSELINSICYSNKVFKPNPNDVRADEFNIYRGMRPTLLPKLDTKNKGYIAFRKHILEVWSGSNPDIETYILSWFAQMVQRPWDKTGVALCLIGSHGVGKGIITDFFRDKILNESNFAESTGIESLLEKHNTNIEGKLLYVLNELPATSDSFHAQFDKMKPFITDGRVRINPKMVTSYSIENHMNFIMFSNNPLCLKVEGGDRRYFITEPSPKYKGDHAYFSELRDALFTDESADTIFTFLMNYNGVNVKNIPQTRLRSELQEASRPNPPVFIDHLKTHISEYAKTDDGMKFIRGARIRKSHVYTLYTLWCFENSEVAMKKNSFFVAISTQVSKGVRDGYDEIILNL